MQDNSIHRIIATRDITDDNIVRLISLGRTNKEIALELFLAHQTVRNRVSRILHVTGMLNRTQLAVTWLKETEVSEVLSTGERALAVEPTEQHGDRPRVMTQPVPGSLDDPRLGRAVRLRQHA